MAGIDVVYARSREPWSKEAVWRKLSAFCNQASIQKQLGRQDKNEQDIMFAIKTARDFLLQDSPSLSTALIENYYGTFWIVSAMAMIADENISLKDISVASGKGHGLSLVYKHSEDNPLDWHIFIQQTGFMNFILRNKPFSVSNINAVSLAPSVGKRHLEDDFSQHKASGYRLDDLMTRFPELEWHYELLTGAPGKFCHLAQSQPVRLTCSKLATSAFISAAFPNVCHLVPVNGSAKQAKNSFEVQIAAPGAIPNGQLPLHYDSLLTDVNTVAKLDKPLDDYLLWHLMATYAWSIVARYTPHYLQRIEGGDLSEWKPYLDEYNWFIKIWVPTRCLNQLTAADWRFATVSLRGG